ncbi:MAG: bifunctional adenosylcobinamide kinase/adenosylcobinamide-phosphate guanylyltransferase [Gemmatimonas sp.]
MTEPMTLSLPLTLLLGGVRAGKSARALRIATQFSRTGDDVVFVATAQAFDDEMKHRISAHRAERDARWSTIEEPTAVASVLRSHIGNVPQTRVVVVDCATLWVSNIMLGLEDGSTCEARIGDQVSALIDVLRDTARAPDGSAREFIVVSNEVGLGIVPPTPLGRQYRDALGRANQLLAAAARDVLLMVAGLELRLKGTAPM